MNKFFIVVLFSFWLSYSIFTMHSNQMQVSNVNQKQSLKDNQVLGTCSICLDDCMQKNGSKTICSHAFHKKCLERWTEKTRKETCPNCRGELFSKGEKFVRRIRWFKDDIVSIFTCCIPKSYKENDE